MNRAEIIRKVQETIDAREFIEGTPTVGSIAEKWGFKLEREWTIPSNTHQPNENYVYTLELKLPKPAQAISGTLDTIKVTAHYAVDHFAKPKHVDAPGGTYFLLDLSTNKSPKSRHSIGTNETTVAYDFDHYMEHLMATLRRWRGTTDTQLHGTLHRWARQIDYAKGPEARAARAM